jgi:hypothetical protein
VVDNVLVVYFFAILLLLFAYSSQQRLNQKKRPKEYLSLSSNIKKQSIITHENWKEKIKGIWQQFKANDFERFSELTEPSAMKRAIGAIAFFKVRHTIEIRNGYFELQRDLGMSVSVWNLKIKMGSNKENAESLVVPVETGNYRFRVWINEENKELCMESSPVEGVEGVTTIQTRTLLDNDLMKMVSGII